MPEVAVALSGGVDSSVAAALLVEAGRDVFGLTMRLGLAEIAGRPCCGEEEAALARRVCSHLGIPHVVIDVADAFRASVVEPFCDSYAAGSTPNPCVTCNERIKFGLLAERARELGATTLATGHYARLAHDAGEVWLERAADHDKDQSYFLYRVPAPTLALLEFPLGSYTKTEVRKMAEARGLPTAARRDSQEVCFTADHAALVEAAHPGAGAPGPIERTDGARLGTHRGIARYTVGQRKGLGIGGPDGPYRVLRIDAARSAVIVEPEAAPGMTEVLLSEPVWRLGIDAEQVYAQMRYHARPVAATARPEAAGLRVSFESPVAPLAPGQSVVLLVGDRIIGGGIVSH